MKRFTSLAIATILAGCGGSEKPCGDRFERITAFPLEGPVRATYTYAIDDAPPAEQDAFRSKGLFNVGPPDLSGVIGDPEPTKRSFFAEAVDARGAILMADRTYFRVQTAKSLSPAAAIAFGCSVEARGAELLRIDMTTG